MKKYLIAAITLILLAVLVDTAYYRWGFYINLNKDKKAETFATVHGKEILIDREGNLKPFEIKGVDMGAGIPGHFATDYAIDKKTYLRWFQMIQDMGANTIRVYTILSDEFYRAFYEYNRKNPNPIYLIHGVWVNDYVQNSRLDAYADAFLETFMEDCRTLVDIIHGKKKLNLGYGTTSASGSFTKDISPWVLGYILGVEWEDVTVAYTDHMEKKKNVFSGEYMYATEKATPFEAMLARVGNEIIRYETDRYTQQRLVAFSNWPTTDPLEYPEDIQEAYEKCAKVDVEHIKGTDKFLSGQFASYHIYPYYPDYFNFYEEWKNQVDNLDEFREENGKFNTYKAYLSALNEHHSMPVIISEFGVPTSRGYARDDANLNRSQGKMTEQEQGEAIISCYEDIMEAGCAGSIIFTWQDEWFKRTWNTLANVDLTQTPFWSDYQTNEQFFGILTFDPGEKKSVCYVDGDISEWNKSDIVSQGKYCLSMKYDEKFLYFLIQGDGIGAKETKLYIPIDVTPKSGSFFAEGENVKFERQSDFLVVLNGEEDSRILVQERYDAFHVVFSEYFGEKNPHFKPPEKNSPIFGKIYLALQQNKKMENKEDSIRYETGRLTCGNANPDSPDFNSLADFIVSDNAVEMRLPWQLLNFSNPSKMQVHDDYYEKYGIENMDIEEIYAGVGDAGTKENRIPMAAMKLKGWGNYPTSHERLKKSYEIIQKAWKEE